MTLLFTPLFKFRVNVNSVSMQLMLMQKTCDVEICLLAKKTMLRHETNNSLDGQ